MVTTNGTVVDDNIPSPQGNSVPLLDLELLLVRIIGALGDGLALGGASSGFLHLHVCHIEVLVEIWMVSVRNSWRRTTEAS